MERRTQVARNVSSAIAEAGVDPASIAHAADIHPADLPAYLNGARDFTVAQLVNVGGVLRVPTAAFLEGAA